MLKACGRETASLNDFMKCFATLCAGALDQFTIGVIGLPDL